MAGMRTENAFGDNFRGFQLGQNFGHVHLAPERPETPPQPASNILFDTTHTSQGRTGRARRSRLAIEYARQLRQRSSQTWVLWIHASNAARFEQSVRDVADQLKLYGRKDPKADILQLLRNWLRDESKGKWLIVLDNADDAGFLLELPATTGEGQPVQRRIDYIPACDHGSVLITTRSKSEAVKLVDDSETIDVLPMSEGEAEALLESKLGQSSQDHRELAWALDRMPLAITQAAAYIRERTPRCSAQQYLREMEQSRASQTSLLRRGVPLPSRDTEANNSVLLTWQISFNHIYSTRGSAAELLSLMSFCDRLAIPQTLIRVDEGERSEESNGVSTFEEDIVALRSFSFISPTTDAHTWEMHRLVQDATQVWLDGRGRLEEVYESFVHRLCTTFPTGHFENWQTCRTLFPHAKGAAGQRPTDPGGVLEWATVMYRSAWYALEQGELIDALTMGTAAMTARSEQLGGEHEETLWSKTVVSWAYRNQGRWKEAEELEVKVMETRVRVLGGEHPDTLSGMANLASTYRNQGRWKEAEELEVKVMETSRSVLGGEHPDTLTSTANLASTYRNQGRWKEAEELQVKVMETSRRVLGGEHPSTLTSTANLGVIYSMQGRQDQAEELKVKVMETRVRVLGGEHPDTLSGMANLAVTYQNQGRWKEAEELEVKVMETRVRVQGGEHPDTLSSMANLASTYWNQGRWKEAEELQSEAAEASRMVLGRTHPATLARISALKRMAQEKEVKQATRKKWWRKLVSNRC
ncbi:hypothetical protein LTR17_027226 [Elasticomyces elasticus]|nr:hypothetical protein LTR17_027226 [Elasticomyces elasticus]